jgi:propanediol utilization protein
MALHGPRGDVNGALLEDGTILRLPPDEAPRFANLLQPGQMVVAEGVAAVNALGKVLDVRQIGPSREQLGSVEAPPGPRGRPRP